MDSLNSLVVFVQVAETRSFVAAGRALGVSASAIGKSIARLEDRLGVRLFHRSTRSMTLTAEGALFVERGRRILAELAAAEQELAHPDAAPSGRLRISLPQVGMLFLPMLSDFMAAYPHIELDLDVTDRIVDVIEDGFDAVVRTGAPRDSRLAARKLGDYRYLLVASPAYLAQHGMPAVPADLTRHACLHYRFAHTGKLEDWGIERGPGEPEWQLPISMVCNSVETRVHFAVQGRGIAFLPDFAIRRELSRGDLCEVLAGQVGRGGSFTMLWPNSKYPAPRVRALVDFMRERTALGVLLPAR